MIPMTPIPPTIRPTDDSESMIKANTPMNVSKISMSWSERMMPKSFSSPGRRPRIARMEPMTWSCASAAGKAESGTTQMLA